MSDQNIENSGNEPVPKADKNQEQSSHRIPERDLKSTQNNVSSKNNMKLYIEIALMLVGIILIAIASIQVKSIADVKWYGSTEVAFPLGIILIASPAVLYIKKFRNRKPAMVVIIMMLIGILLLYILLIPYKMFTVRFGLLGDVIVEYLIGIFLLIFMISHMARSHLLKNK